MAMLITARMIDQSDTRVRYEYGIENEPTKTLDINPTSGELIDADPHDRAIGKIYIKIKREWESSGHFPSVATFAS